MVLDKIQGLGLGLNHFVKPKDAEENSSSGQLQGIGYKHDKHAGRRLALGQEKAPEKRPDGISFLREGALGNEEAVHVNNGRAGAKLNLIS